MKIIFMGTPAFSVCALDALHAAGHEAGHEICAVYTRPPTKSGRGMQMRQSPVHARAEALGLPVFTPATLKVSNLKSDDIQAQIRDHAADLAVVVAYGLLLPQAVLDAPRLGCWNIHASLLPRWRGAAPIQRALMKGDKQSGICIMKMEAGLDTGAVLLRKPIDIAPDDTSASLHDRLKVLGAAAIVEALETKTDSAGEPQSEQGVTYAHKISKTEARIDWSRSAIELDRHIRGLSPFLGAWCEVKSETPKGFRVKILQASAIKTANKSPSSSGTIINIAPLTIACGSNSGGSNSDGSNSGGGALELIRVQKAGKPAMDAADFQRGANLSVGDILPPKADIS